MSGVLSLATQKKNKRLTGSSTVTLTLCQHLLLQRLQRAATNHTVTVTLLQGKLVRLISPAARSASLARSSQKWGDDGTLQRLHSKGYPASCFSCSYQPNGSDAAKPESIKLWKDSLLWKNNTTVSFICVHRRVQQSSVCRSLWSMLLRTQWEKKNKKTGAHMWKW